MTVMASASVPLTPGRWTHLACTYDGVALALHVDGVVVSSTISLGTTVATGITQGLYIGSGVVPTNAYIGQIDELRIFSMARTARQICADAGLAQCP